VATVFHEPMSRARVDLDRLNEAEKRVLRLLAQGHTAKSIANAIDSTPAAVNERLREARRKTGVGSSRELARLLRGQESRHEQMGVVRTSASPVQSPVMGGRSFRSDWVGPIAMILGLITVLGAAALTLQQPASHPKAPANARESDPLFASIFAEQDPTKLFDSPHKTRKDFERDVSGEGFRAILRQFHAKVHSETSDAAWASKTENALRAAFVSIPNVGAKGTELRVFCGSTLCEIAGTLKGPARSKAAIDQFNRATMYRLNPKALEPDTDKLGLKSMVASFGTMPDDRMSYVFYYSRKS
jgi:DNA-binding CsgD family transcriptional regulator